MLKAVDDANGCVESRLIAVLKAFRFLQTALLRLLFFGTAAAKFAIDSEKAFTEAMSESCITYSQVATEAQAKVEDATVAGCRIGCP